MKGIKIAETKKDRRLAQIMVAFFTVGFFSAVIFAYNNIAFLDEALQDESLQMGWVYAIWDNLVGAVACVFGIYMFGSMLSEKPDKILNKILADRYKMGLFLALSLIGFSVSIFFIFYHIKFSEFIWIDLISEIINLSIFGCLK
jgi:multidrug transporter EmrE-like cation transporter